MLTASEIKNLFKEHKLAPKKWMGQNLLVDPNYLKRIVEAAQIAPESSVLEIGAGLGVLTEQLLTKSARIWALELDSGFFRILESKFADNSRLTLVHTDALKFDFVRLFREIGKYKVVANLPYNVSSRLIFHFFEQREAFDGLFVLLQREVAERLVAEVGTKDYGILTVLLGINARVRLMFNIPSAAFYPAPTVISTFVHIQFERINENVILDDNILINLVKTSFSSRRKTLRNTLKNTAAVGLPPELVAAVAKQLNIDLNRRGETLSPEEYRVFANQLAASQQ